MTLLWGEKNYEQNYSERPSCISGISNILTDRGYEWGGHIIFESLPIFMVWGVPGSLTAAVPRAAARPAPRTESRPDVKIKSPPASFYIKEAVKLKGGSKEPGRNIVASISKKQLENIAKEKMNDLNAHDIEEAIKIIAGSARSMGIEVKE